MSDFFIDINFVISVLSYFITQLLCPWRLYFIKETYTEYEKKIKEIPLEDKHPLWQTSIEIYLVSFENLKNCVLDKTTTLIFVINVIGFWRWRLLYLRY